MYTHSYINGISVFPAHSVLEQMSNPSSVDRPVISTCSFMLAGRDTCYLTSVWEVGDVIRASAAGLKHTCQLHHLEITMLSQPASVGGICRSIAGARGACCSRREQELLLK